MRIKDNLSHLEGQPFSIVRAFEADGIEPLIADWPDLLEFKDRRFRYRIIDWCTLRPIVRVAVRDSFDRWSNSIDFVFSVPTTLRAYRKRMRLLDRAYASGRYDTGFGQEIWI